MMIGSISRNLLFSLVAIFGFLATVSAQNTRKAHIQELMNDPGLSFQQVTEQIDSIFALEDASASLELDGVRTKYERWKHLWRGRLDERGNRVDYTAYFQHAAGFSRSSQGCDDLEIDVEWQNVNYNEHLGYQIDHGRTSTIAFSPSDANTYYVGSAWGGIWKTEDGGQTYLNLNDRLPLAAVSGIYVDPLDEDHLLVALSDIVWYGSNGIGIFETYDGGQSFQTTGVNFPLNQNRRIYSMTSNPGNPDILFACTSYGLLRSDDFFATYTTITGGPFQAVKFCQSNPNTGYATNTNGRLYKTTDAGSTFTLLVDLGAGTARLDVDNNDPDKLVVTCDDQIYFSTDGGNNFTQSTLPESNCVVSLIPGTTSGVTVGNFDIYRSDNAGVSFTQTSHWLGDNGLPVVHVDQRNCFSNPYFPNGVYFCNDGGVFRYNPAANDFDNLSKDLIITQYYDIAISQLDSTILGGGSQDNGNVTRNSNGNWQAYAGTGDGMEQAIHLGDPNIRFWEYQYGGMRRYDALSGNNSNIEPAAQSANGAWHTPYILDPNNTNRMICGFQRVYESNDLGDNWNYLGSDFTNGASLEFLAVAPSNSDFVYAATGANLWRRTDLNDWTACTTPPVNGSIGDMVVDNQNPEHLYLCYTGFYDGKKVYESTDGGATWNNISFDLPNLPMTALHLLDVQLGASESGLFVGSLGAVYFLPDGGTEWYKYGCLPVTEISDIEIQYNTNKIFIGTHGRGMFEARMSSFDLVGVEEGLTAETIRVYPNPASSEVQISASSPITSVQVFDPLSRLVYQRAGANLNLVQVDISNLKKGIYWFEITTSTGKRTVQKVLKL